MTTTSTVNSTVPYADTSSTLQTVGKQQLNQDDFMKLFITQLQFQDPLKPMDSYEMASQMAQFSNMNATMQMADNMQKLLDYQKSQNNLQLLGLIGKNVQVAGQSFAVTNGAPAPTQFSLASAAQTCQVAITDAAGNTVRTLNLGAVDAGSHDVAWDGKDYSGKTVPDGTYNFAVKAMDSAGQQVTASYLTTGKVTGLNFNGSAASVVVDDKLTMAVSDITEVR